jgi:hypothetical protein
MAKKYGITDLSEAQAERRGKLKKLFSEPLFPKGTGGVFPEYDKALKKKQANVEMELPISKKRTKSKDFGVSLHGGSKKKAVEVDESPKKPKTFAEAFKAAKGQKTFTFKGKSYARVTKDELEKKGFKSLRAYLNAQKGTKVAKRP